MSGRISSMAKAMQGWDIPLTAAYTKPAGAFGQRIIINTETVKISSDVLDCEFNIPFDDDTEANEAEIVIYNLSQNTISNLKYNDGIVVTAGYGDDVGIIFSGYISKVSAARNGVDDKTTINAIDSMSLKEREIKSIAYKKGVKASYILKDLIGRTGVSLATFKPIRDYTYKDGKNVDGELMEAIREQARICGVSAYISKGKVEVRSIKDGDDIGFTVSADTGLIESPEYFEEEIESEEYKDIAKGYKIKMLLQHRITTAAKLNVQSRNVSGVFRVRSGEHTYDGKNMLTQCEVIS